MWSCPTTSPSPHFISHPSSPSSHTALTSPSLHPHPAHTSHHPHTHLTPPSLSLQDVAGVVEQLQNEQSLLAILRRLSRFDTDKTPPPEPGDIVDQQLLDQDYIDHPVGLRPTQPLVVEEESSVEKQRVVFDQLADEQQCRTLMQLAWVRPIPNWRCIPNEILFLITHPCPVSHAEWHRGGWLPVQVSSHQAREV